MWADLQSGRQRHSRRTRVLVAVGAAAAAATVVSLAAAGGRGDGEPAAPPAVAVRTAAPSPSPVGPTTFEAAEMMLASKASTAVRYTFDAGPGRAMVAAGGTHQLRAITAAGGTFSFARHGAGYALRFPARCRQAPAKCPRAILQSTRADLFNPGTRPLRFGAAVLMRPADTAAGANVLQKGFSVGGGTQYKLQVDGRAGRPSCVVAGPKGIYRLTSPTGIADGRWHSVACTRIGGWMSINVDGRALSRRVPPGLSISNGQPLRIGGKSVGPYNDQYAGQIDNVFVTIY